MDAWRLQDRRKGKRSSGEGSGSSAEEQFEVLDKDKIMLGHIQAWRNDVTDPTVDMEMGDVEKIMMRYREAKTDDFTEDRKIIDVWSVTWMVVRRKK